MIVAYTKKAASYYGDVKRELVELAIEEANKSFRISSLGHVKLRLVHAYETNYVEEDGEHFQHAGALPTRAMATWTRSMACATSTAPMSAC